MDPVTNEEGGKPKVGSFVAGGGQAEQASQSSAGLPQDTLDERLEKVGEGRDDSLPDYLQEKNETITISPAPQTIEKIQGVPSISMSAPIPREDIVIPQEVPEVKEMPQEVRRAEEVRKVAEVSQEATVPAPLPQMEILPPATPPQETQPEVYHTVSGGPETVRDTVSKKIETIQEQEKYSTIGMPPSEPETLVKKEPQSLSLFWFKLLIAVELIVVVLHYGASTLLESLASLQYITLGTDGTYSYQSLIVPSNISVLLLHTAIVGAVLGLLCLIFTGIIDMITGKLHLFFKFLILCVLLGVITGTLVMLKGNGFDIVEIIRKALLALGIVLFPHS